MFDDPLGFDHGDEASALYWANLLGRGMVPPDPPAFPLAGALDRKVNWDTVEMCRAIVPEWRNIEAAARLAVQDLHEDAAVQRKIAGYDG